MKKILVLLVLLLSLSACATEPPVETQALTPEPTAQPTPTINQYINSDFGLRFEYPLDWFIQDYVSDNILRVEVGSDVVYPYGERPEEPSQVTNSYSIIIQYTKSPHNLPNQNETYQSLMNMQDGQSISDVRTKITRVRQLEIGRFTGIEYMTTLSETAQTPPIYSREVILIDDQANIITIFGTPNNVLVNESENWRDVYQSIDEENMNIFHQIIQSITLN